MVQGREGASFALEAQFEIGIGGEKAGQNFDSNYAVQAQIAGTVHVSHTACADGRNYFVRAQPCSACQDHGHAPTSGRIIPCNDPYIWGETTLGEPCGSSPSAGFMRRLLAWPTPRKSWRTELW